MRKELKALILTTAAAVLLMGCGGKEDYTFKCVDSQGQAIEGVKLEACTDNMCRTGDSDGEGLVTFPGEEDSYTMHVLKVPEGYVYNGEEEFTVSGGGSVTEVTFDAE